MLRYAARHAFRRRLSHSPLCLGRSLVSDGLHAPRQKCGCTCLIVPDRSLANTHVHTRTPSLSLFSFISLSPKVALQKRRAHGRRWEYVINSFRTRETKARREGRFLLDDDSDGDSDSDDEGDPLPLKPQPTQVLMDCLLTPAEPPDFPARPPLYAARCSRGMHLTAGTRAARCDYHRKNQARSL
jgi:hypothetical protein